MVIETTEQAVVVQERSGQGLRTGHLRGLTMTKLEQVMVTFLRGSF